jgi:AraC family transcriptional regulator
MASGPRRIWLCSCEIACSILLKKFASAHAALRQTQPSLARGRWMNEARAPIYASAIIAPIGMTDTSERLYAEALIIVFLREVSQRARDASRTAMHTGGLASWQRNKVASYIDENLDQRISLATVARLVRLSRFHFARAFKRSFGLPPHRYHNERRIALAKDLLAHSTHSVTEIALKVGFSEASAFTTAFRRMTGLAPSDYRRTIA